MKNYFNALALTLLLLLGFQEAVGQSCDTTAKTEVNESVSNKGQSKTGANSGCTPSACRGAKTKFGEAKVISELRLSLIDLKSKMESHKAITFNPRSYSVHGIIGKSDDESLQIIRDEIAIMEKEITDKSQVQFPTIEFPENKAKLVSVLRSRMETLEKAL